MLRRGTRGKRTHFAVAFSAEGDGGRAADGGHAGGGLCGGAFGAGGDEGAVGTSTRCERDSRFVSEFHLGSISTTVHPSRSRYPARTALACMSSLRNKRLKLLAHFLHDSERVPDALRRLLTSRVSLHRSHLTVILRDNSSNSSIPYSSRLGKESDIPRSGRDSEGTSGAAPGP